MKRRRRQPAAEKAHEWKNTPEVEVGAEAEENISAQSEHHARALSDSTPPTPSSALCCFPNEVEGTPERRQIMLRTAAQDRNRRRFRQPRAPSHVTATSTRAQTANPNSPPAAPPDNEIRPSPAHRAVRLKTVFQQHRVELTGGRSLDRFPPIFTDSAFEFPWMCADLPHPGPSRQALHRRVP